MSRKTSLCPVSVQKPFPHPAPFSVERMNLSRAAHTHIPRAMTSFPECAPPLIERGKGCHVWDVDGNEFIEYGMGLRAVTLGHAFEPVVHAASRQMQLGANYTRPAKN